MLLPIVKTAAECADFSRTVTPYLGQLQVLPRLVWDSILVPAALKQIYVDTNPLITAFAFALAISPIFLVVSEANRNYSQVDRMWSVLPTIYNIHYVVYSHLVGLDTRRLDAVLVVSCLWSVRTTCLARVYCRTDHVSSLVSLSTTGAKVATPLAARTTVGKFFDSTSTHTCSSCST